MLVLLHTCHTAHQEVNVGLLVDSCEAEGVETEAYERKGTLPRITIPASIEEVTTKLNGLEALLTTKEYERSALVFAFTRPSQGQRSDLSRKGEKLTFTAFAKLGIAGLRKADTVAAYHQAWIDANGALDIGPGDRVELPATPWPGRQDDSGKKRYVEKDEAAVGRSIARKELDVEVLAQNLSDADAAAVVARITEDRPTIVRKIERQAAIQEAIDEGDTETLSQATAKASQNRRVIQNRKRLAEGDWPKGKRPKVIAAENEAFLFVVGLLNEATRKVEEFRTAWAGLDPDVRHEEDLVGSANETLDLLDMAATAARGEINGTIEAELDAMARGE
jgi:hypothetical protein